MSAWKDLSRAEQDTVIAICVWTLLMLVLILGAIGLEVWLG